MNPRELKFLTVAAIVATGLALAGCGGGGSSTPTPAASNGDTMPAPHACDAGPSAACVAARQAELDALGEDDSKAAHDAAEAALAAAQTALATATARTEQMAALMEAAGAIDTSDDALSTQEGIDAAEAAVADLQAAIDAATDVGDTSMYQTQADEAGEAVRMAQTGLDKQGRMAAQRTALSNAVDMARTAGAGVGDDSTDSEVSSADSAIAALQAAIDGAEDLPEGDADVASAQGTLDTLTGALAAAKTSRTAALEEKATEMAKADAKLGKDLRAALGGTTADNNALANVTATTLGTAGLGVTVADDAGVLTGATTVPTLKAVEGSATALGSWNGMMYAHTDTGTKVKNEAVVYHNRGPGKREAFNDVHVVHTEATAGDDIKGYYTVDETADVGEVGGTAFTHSGTQNHTYDPTTEAAFTTRGTFDGAPGMFRCTGTCSSTNDGTGSPSALGGVWHFKPDSGAMVHQPDADYLYFGWWLNKDKDGVPTAASAFAGLVGGIAGDGTTALMTAPDALTGSATYEGHAAGKFAMSNVLDGTGSGGHFTADATLTAKFGANTAPNNGGVSGMISNFMAGGEAKPWSVELKRAGWDSGAAKFGGAGNEATTVWSVDGNKAPESGGWSGTVYDEKPGSAPSGDGSDVPTTVTGTFYSEFSTIGRMVGAFGANKQ